MATLATVGINLAGAEFDYVFWPAANYLDHIAGKGVRLLRLPIRWEKLQPTRNGALDSGYVGKLKETLIACAARGIKVQPEIHNYAWVAGQRLESLSTSYGRAELLDLMLKLDGALAPLATDARPIGYGLMNEPNNMPQERVTWKAIAQHVVTGFRKQNMQALLYVCGDGWSGAHSWQSVNRDFILNDPADRIVYEAHQYFDWNSSGLYERATAVADGATVNTAIARLKPFVEWGRANNVRLAIGEMGVPYNKDTAAWFPIINRAYDYLAENGVEVYHWAGGDHLGPNNVCTLQTEVFTTNQWVASSFKDTATFTQVVQPRLNAYVEVQKQGSTGTTAPPVTPPSPPEPQPQLPESTDGASLTGTAGQVVDSTGAVWTLKSAPEGMAGLGIYRNGIHETYSQRVTLLLYVGKVVYQQNADGGWWKYENGGWPETTDPRASAPLPVEPPVVEPPLVTEPKPPVVVPPSTSPIGDKLARLDKAILEARGVKNGATRLEYALVQFRKELTT